MKKELLPLALGLVLVITLTLFSRNFIREVIIIPLLYLFWIGRFLLEAIPQTALWSVAVGLFLLILGVGLIGQRKRKARLQPPPRIFEGRIEKWARLLQQAEQGIYFKWRLAQQLQKVLLRIVAHQTGQSIKQTRQQLRHNQLDLPPVVQAYFKASLQPLGSLASPRWFFQQRSAGPSPLDLDPAYVVQFLEQLNAYPYSHPEKIEL